MDFVFFWAQIVGLFAMTINILAWQIKAPRMIILCCVPSSFLWALQYFLLGAPLGALMNGTSMIKDLALVFIRQELIKYLIAAFLCVAWSVGLYFSAGLHDLLPLLATTFLNISFLQRDNRELVARASIAAQVCWISYNIIVLSFMGIATGVLCILSTVIGMARYEKWAFDYRDVISLSKHIFIMPRFRPYP